MLKSAAVTLFAAVALATPPGIPSTSAAKSQLSSLTVAPYFDNGGYDRDLFRHWERYSGSCNTREYVLQRDGTNVLVASNCAATSGKWYSPFDGATWTAASDVDIDHMVPLKNAWVSGASDWTSSQRKQFANDVTRPQLWAVTDNVNQEKSSQSPDDWKPPLKAFHCTYAKSWVQVKSHWELTITSSEKRALSDMLDTCDSGSGSDDEESAAAAPWGQDGMAALACGLLYMFAVVGDVY